MTTKTFPLDARTIQRVGAALVRVLPPGARLATGIFVGSLYLFGALALMAIYSPLLMLAFLATL